MLAAPINVSWAVGQALKDKVPATGRKSRLLCVCFLEGLRKAIRRISATKFDNQGSNCKEEAGSSPVQCLCVR